MAAEREEGKACVYNMIVTLNCVMCKHVVYMPDPYEKHGKSGALYVEDAIFEAYNLHRKEGCRYSKDGMRKI